MKMPFKLPCLMDSSAGNPRKLHGLAGFPTFDQALCMGGPESWRECPGHNGMIIGMNHYPLMIVIHYSYSLFYNVQSIQDSGFKKM